MIAHSQCTRLEDKYPEMGYTDKIQLPLNIEVKELKPQEFIRRVFGLDQLSEDLATLHETQVGFDKKARKMLAQVLNVAPKTVREWGTNYDRMPNKYHIALGYAYYAMKLQREVHLEESKPKIRRLKAV